MKTVVNTKTIDTFSKKLLEESNILNNIIDDMILLTKDMEKFFDTNTSKLLKESLMDYLTKSKETCSALGDFGLTVNKLNHLYINDIESIEKSING